MKRTFFNLLLLVLSYSCTNIQDRTPPIVPSNKEINRPFGSVDKKAFQSPPLVYHPETWFHFIGGNVAKKGITADLEAIAGAGISGIQLFHGNGGRWLGVEPQITCLSEPWDDAVQYTAAECRRLGLRFTMQNCPGWATAGGPWIELSNTMRHLVWSRTDVDGQQVSKALPQPQHSNEEWSDYKDIALIAFPTPLDDTDEPLKPKSLKSSNNLPWNDFLSRHETDRLQFGPTTDDKPHWVEVTFPKNLTLRTVELSSIRRMNLDWCFEPDVKVAVHAVFPNGTTAELLHLSMPQSTTQDDMPISLACREVAAAATYRISFVNKHDMTLRSLRLFSAARKSNWEADATWVERSILHENDNPQQSLEAFVAPGKILDITDSVNENGVLQWTMPDPGKWTILRIGHVNTGRRNGPATPEGTGWECNKLSPEGPEAHFAGYIGRLADGPLAGGLLSGMLLDSWECYTQTWTSGMEDVFAQQTGYTLRQWLPAVFGYVVGDHETTIRFLRDWRRVINHLFTHNYYGRISELAKAKGLNLTYETSAADVFPADILEYYKYADVPMCEFWHPHSNSFVGSINFKPVKPTASAARIYGKSRVAAEAFTSFDLSFDEHLSMLKEVANLNCIEGVTHLVFHTYTHNPRTDQLSPGTSFGCGIGTPFLRGQTWWKYMPDFTTYLSRLNYLLERGKPVSDVLWYLGDEINHKPNQNAPFPAGFKYDYCNPDVLLHRLSVKDGKIVTPEGITYRVLWLPDNKRMLPETLEKLLALVREGAVIIGDAPQGLATLTGGASAQSRFDVAVNTLWERKGETTIGKGKMLSGMTIDESLAQLHLMPDVIGNGALWLHRQTKGADWYFVSAPYGSGFQGTLDFNCSGAAHVWDPVTGEITPAAVEKQEAGRTSVRFDLARAGSCFVVFDNTGKPAKIQPITELSKTRLTTAWTLLFPAGWGAPASLQTHELKAWKDLDVSPEAKAFSGTMTYTTTFDVGTLNKTTAYTLDLGRVEMIASIILNGKKLRTLWTPPYSLDVTDALKSGENTLQIEVTSTWFNRLVYDAGQPEDARKTWVIDGPRKDKELRESGLLGPVTLAW
jgi:hypothetical protein